VSWALDAGRAAMAGDPDWGSVGLHGGWLLVLTVLSAGLATFSFRGYQKAQ
jgi:ABC-2 type transport system permease protein